MSSEINQDRSRGVVGIFILVGLLFFIFLFFAFYTVLSLKSSTDSDGARSFDYMSKDAEIAVVEVEGAIMDSKKTIEKLLQVESTKGISALIVRVNSPGGAVGPTQEIYEEMRRIDKTIPVYASFGAIAASGGYYIGAAARKIYASAGTMTGSIGVIMNFMNLEKLYEFAKVRPEIIKAGKYKDIGSPNRDMTQEERLLLNQMTADVHEQFIQDIFSVRGDRIKGGLEALRGHAQGQIFSGSEAKRLGLVDENLGLWEAGRAIHKELELKSKFGLKFIKLKKENSFFEILGNIDQASSNLKQFLKLNAAPLYMYSN